MADAYTFSVAGHPAPKGSMRAIMVRGHAVLAQGGTNAARARLREWTKALQAATELAVPEPFVGPVALSLTFRMERPPSHPKTRRTWSDGHGVGDLDKLCRAVLDAMTATKDGKHRGAFADDSQVVALAATKDWGGPLGVSIRVSQAPPNAARPDAFAGWVINQQALALSPTPLGYTGATVTTDPDAQGGNP